MADNQKEGGTATCPVCQLKLPLSEIEAHVQEHFGMSQNSGDPTITEDRPTVACLQCGEDVALDQYASHEAAHRYYASYGQRENDAEALSKSVRLCCRWDLQTLLCTSTGLVPLVHSGFAGQLQLLVQQHV